ncbi:MAG: hypothetical protein AB1508_17265 [Pseudomonadota bacterium]
MPVKLSKSVPLVAAFLAAAAFQNTAAHAESALRSLAGYWGGSGIISMKNGTHERIRCRGSYAISDGGDALNQSLLCASDSYKFNVQSNVSESAGGVLRGSWAETTRNANGQLVGRVAGSHIVANVQGVGFTALISIVTHGRSQSVAITPSGGTDVVGVTVAMHRE